MKERRERNIWSSYLNHQPSHHLPSHLTIISPSSHHKIYRGELPCVISHGGTSNFLTWSCPLENLGLMMIVRQIKNFYLLLCVTISPHHLPPSHHLIYHLTINYVINHLIILFLICLDYSYYLPMFFDGLRW